MKRVLKILAASFALLVVGLLVATLVLASRFDALVTLPDTPYPEVQASTDPQVVARGEYLVRTVGHCPQCHGAYARDRPQDNTPDVALSGRFEFDMEPLATLYSANLTSDQETGLGRWSDREVARVLATGVLPNGQLSIFMRYSAARFSQEDLVPVLSYLRTLAPVKQAVPPPKVGLLGKAAFSTMALSANNRPLPAGVPASDEPSVERGAYLAENVALCVTCHSHLDPSTFEVMGPKAAGGDADPSPGQDADKEFAPPNLTSHPMGLTSLLSENAFVMRLHGARAYPSSKMPWENLSRMSEADARSLYRYFRSLPPTDNEVGPSYRPRGWKKD